jgi:hypothetical protein
MFGDDPIAFLRVHTHSQFDATDPTPIDVDNTNRVGRRRQE